MILWKISERAVWPVDANLEVSRLRKRTKVEKFFLCRFAGLSCGKRRLQFRVQSSSLRNGVGDPNYHSLFRDGFARVIWVLDRSTPGNEDSGVCRSGVRTGGGGRDDNHRSDDPVTYTPP